MISENLKKYATEKFEGRRELLAPVMPVIEEKLKQCSEEEAVLMKFLYGTMPVRDAGEYGFDLFLSYVKHALMLREKVAWCKELPEDVFVNYVLYDRINSENITDCRPFFYEQIMGRVAGMSLWEAILEINYWCAEHATYEATDSRTASPMTMYRSGKGRCGEESTFAVTAYRSVGIAARQVIHRDGHTVMTIMRGLRCLWTASGISLAPVSRKKCWIPAGSPVRRIGQF